MACVVGVRVAGVVWFVVGAGGLVGVVGSGQGPQGSSRYAESIAASTKRYLT